MIGMYILWVWVVIGFVSTFYAIHKFRQGKMVPYHELFLAAIGPLFGAIVPVLIVIDLLKKKK